VFEAYSRPFTVILLFCAGACAAQGETGIQKPPVIDRQDIRFIPLTVNGVSLRARIWSITQDTFGILWLGTSDGLYHYDGYGLRRYENQREHRNRLGSDPIRFVYKDRVGALWISNLGGLYRLDPTDGRLAHYRHNSRNSRSLINDLVLCAYQDREGALWFGTSGGLDRLDPSTGAFIHFTSNPEDPRSLSGQNIKSIFEDSRGNLWVGTDKGLNKLNRATGHFSRFQHDPKDLHSLGQDYVNSISEDQSGVIWVSSPFGNGLSALDVMTGRFTNYSFHAEEVSRQGVVGVNRLFKAKDGALWVCTVDKGLLKWNRDRGAFLRYARDANDPNTLPHDSIQTMFEDAEGVTWVGTQSGVSRFSSKPPSFRNFRHQAGDPDSLRDDMIWSVHRDRKGFVWIGTEVGLDRLDRKTGQIAHYRHDSKNPYSLSYDKVAAIREDRSGTLWLGTYGGGLNRFDHTTGRFISYRHDERNPGSLSSDAVRSLLLDRQGVLWVGTQGGGLNRFDAKVGRFTAYKDAPYFIQVIVEDRAGILWLGGENGGLYRFDPKTQKFSIYPHKPDDPRSLSSDRVYAIYEDRNGTLWVGTQNGLNRMDRSHGTFTTYTTRDGLPGDAISAILEDARGYLWLATHDGLSRFDPRKKTFRNYSESDGLPDNFLAPYLAEGSFQTEDGEIILGTSKGLTTFHPDRLSDNPHIPRVVLTNFLLFNKPVSPGTGSPLHKPIWVTDSLHLTHEQGIFTLEFAALSYIAPENNRYRYRLEPLEKDWNEVDSRHRTATYTSLPARKYTFRVQGSNNDGIWNGQGVHLDITVLPPWWATWWFRSIAFLGVACLAFAAYRWRVRNLHLAASRLELQVAERTRELRIAKEAADVARDAADNANRAKSSFLANMSHELRTPLNAILGFSSLMRDDNASEKQRKDLDIINRSGEHLLTLINHVLDLAKIEAGRTELQVQPCDLKRLVAEVTAMMRVRAKEKSLPLIVVEPPEFPEFVRVDAAKLRQVLINLLGNAIMFTARGTVTLRLQSRPAGADTRLLTTFEVEDTGIGIALEDQSRIFDAFVQAGRQRSQKGTGLGLTISRQFVELMGGTIDVASAPGKGSRFRVELPVDSVEESQMKLDEAVEEHIVGVDPGRSGYRILIVEDREENWLVLQRLMQKTGFEVRIAEDGGQGIEIFRTWRPHFIWMDLRMPVMDGTETTRHIRALDGGQDVKIVAVTASAFASEREEVLAAGIDDFVPKPFQPSEIYNCMARHLGLQRIYDKRPQKQQSSALTWEDVRELSPDLVRELSDVIVTLDQRRILEVIARIRDCDATLADKLTYFADRFSYTPIMEAVRDHGTEAN
jgi:signal transduction histidine kinase/ligand-binding sensor domain-containing protein/DNA-binding response OmpR family regulator